jgi:hypothetical protein
MLACIDPSSTWRTEFNESVVCGTITEMFALLCRIRMFPEPEIHATETYIMFKEHASSKIVIFAESPRGASPRTLTLALATCEMTRI